MKYNFQKKGEKKNSLTAFSTADHSFYST